MLRIAPLLLLVACADPSREEPRVTAVARDVRGVPRLVHAATTPVVAATPTEAARLQLARIAPAYRVDTGALPGLEAAGEVPVRGGTIVRLRQVIDGVPVEDGELRALVRPDTTLAVASGTLVAATTPRRPFAGALDETAAIARVVQGLHGGRPVTVQQARAQRVWHRAGDALEPAWIVELVAEDDAVRSVLADDGRVLAQRSLVADASYRVFAETAGDNHPFDGPIVDPTPHPTGTPTGQFPAFVAPNLVTVESLNSLGDPWLPPGGTETSGNNVDAYTDVNAPDGLSAGDFRATTTAPGVFDRTYDLAAEPLASAPQQMAAVTSLFYVLNWLHDFWYDAGFTESAGNGQLSNYGRGGVEGDPVHAEAQDDANGGSLNNANMATPGDGMSPRMQVFLWSGTDERALAVANRTPAAGTAGFGPRDFDVTAQVVLASPADACAALAGAVTGRIVLVDRGGCSFESKALRIQQAGGLGMLLADNVASATPPGMGGDSTITDTITIASLSVTMAEGAAIKANVAAGTTTATLHRKSGVLLDGALDATLIAHEFGHYLHHRLQSCGTKTCGALSEGWGDFSALLLLARPGDDLTGAFPFAVYPTRSFSADAAYFGIRRAPYSVDPAINALAFRHMAEGEPLPTTHPVLDFGTNSEIHNAGEIWAEALWEGYVALQQAGTDFAQVRRTMQQYVVAGLLLAPADATVTETRDAILAAAFAASPADHDVLIAAFARRGMGSCAIGPARTSTDFTGIVESSDIRGRAEAGAAAVADSVDSCDQDGVLDAGETARITVPIANPGHVAIDDVTVSVTSTTPGITVVTPAIALGTMAPYTATTVDLDVALDPGVRGPLAGELSIDVAATGACLATQSTPLKIRLDTDEQPESSATDTFDALGTAWTSVGEDGWAREAETALDLFWHGPDRGASSDLVLVSPIVTADASAPVVITFTHRFSFEFSNATFFDGGMIEISLDGQTWTDVADLGVVPGYTGALADGNPLAGRMAFVGNSAGYPATTTATLDLGTQLAGKPFQIRFRIVTDPGVGGPGWEIDDVAFAGIVGTPFSTVVADAGACRDRTPGDGGGCCDTGPLRPASGVLALGVLAVILRRRQKRS